MKSIKRLFVFGLVLLGLWIPAGAVNFPTTLSSDSNLYVAKNNCGAVLSTTITSGAATISVNDTSCFPSIGYVTIDEEAMLCTAKTGTTFTGCSRGSDGTTAVSHLRGSGVYHFVIAAHHNVLKDELIGMSTYFFQGSDVHIDTTTTPDQIGLGTTAPSAHLSVWGTGTSNVLSVSSNTSGSPAALVVTNAGNVTTNANLSVGGTLGVTGTSTLAAVGAGATTVTSLTDSGLTSGRITMAGTSGILQDDSDLTFTGGNTLTATAVVGGNLTDSALTSTRVTYAGASGLLTDSSAFTFNGTTVTVPVVSVSTIQVTVGAGSGKVLTSDANGIGTWSAAGAVSGTGTSAQVAYWNGATSLTGDADFTFDGSTVTVSSFSVTNIVGSFTGWVTGLVPATRLGNTSFTVTGDITSYLQKGDKLQYVDGGATEYAYVVSAAFTASLTTVTITSGSDYALGASPSVWRYSKEQTPQGHPIWFNYTPTWTGFSVDPTGTMRFSLNGRVCTVFVAAANNGTSNGTGLTMTGPVAASGTVYFTGVAFDNSAWKSTPARGSTTDASAVITLSTDASGAAWTGSGSKMWLGEVIYTW